MMFNSSDGQEVKTISSKLWHSRLGTPIGVVVVPAGFAPDGKVRIVGLNKVNNDGDFIYGPNNENTNLTDYTLVPTTDNMGSTSTGSHFLNYLP